ncbi:MAG: hypothetical protein MJ051_03190 [Akkermansia sp.]|nr:hypothetical protein [Akkermansia sp.]
MNGLTKLCTALLAALCLLPAAAGQRAKTYAEAQKAAGKEGIIVYVYGPDWNTRSTHMLRDFWESRELDEAAGEAVLLAVPVYQNEKNADPQTAGAQGSLRLPGFCYCPRVLMIDADGEIYADLHGTDDLGSGKGELGVENVRTKLELLRRRNALLEQAEAAEGQEKARLLSQAADLPLIRPSDIVERIRMADPTDRTGCLRRHEFKARDFLYQEMDTKDGFLKEGFLPDLNAIKQHCTRIFSDKNYRVEDRQAAYNLLIGISRQNGIVSQRLKTLIRANMRIGPETLSGRAGNRILTAWGDAKPDKNAARVRKDNRANLRRYAKEKREDKRREDKAKRNIKF